MLQLLKCDAPKAMFCLQGYPDLMFHKDRVIMNGAGNVSEAETSEDEAFEASFQKNPLKGKDGSGPPEKLGELISGVHFVLVVKYLRKILRENRKPTCKAKGLLMDKQMGNIHVCLETGEWQFDEELLLCCKIVTNYVQLSKKIACFHLAKLMHK